MIKLEGNIDPVKVTPEDMHEFYMHPEASEKHWLHNDGSIFNVHYTKRESERVYSENLEGDWNHPTELAIYRQTYPYDCHFAEVVGSITDIWIGVGEIEELKRRARELNYSKIM